MRIHFGLLAVPLLLFAACGPVTSATGPSGLSTSETVLLKQLKAQGHEAVGMVDLADVSGQDRGGGSFSISIHSQTGFSTQQSKNGHPGKDLTDVSRFRVLLLDQSTAPGGIINTPSPTALKADILIDKVPITGGTNRVILFRNVPESIFRYWVVVSALDAADNNITGAAGQASLAFGSPTSVRGKAFVSTIGGDSPVNSGSVLVGPPPAYTVTGTGQLGLSLDIVSETGASLDTLLTVQEGVTTYVGPITVSP